MRIIRLISAALLAIGIAAGPVAADPYEPLPGDPLRPALLDTVRVVAMQDLGGEIEFVVERLLADGDRAYAELTAQRPGGGPIDLAQTPLHLSRGIPTDLIDGPYVIAFLKETGGVWQVVEHSTGATDAWYWEWDCANYAAIFQTIHAPACGGAAQ